MLYSHVLIGSGRSLIFISGQVSRDKEGRIVSAGIMRTQIQQVGENLLTAPDAAVVKLDLVKTTTYVTDISNMPTFATNILGRHCQQARLSKSDVSHNRNCW